MNGVWSIDFTRLTSSSFTWFSDGNLRWLVLRHFILGSLDLELRCSGLLALWLVDLGLLISVLLGKGCQGAGLPGLGRLDLAVLGCRLQDCWAAQLLS